jgi:hypothetical protein
MNFYYLIKSKQLDKRFKDRDIVGISKLDLLYYVTKILYWIWIPIGFFTNKPELFFVLFTLAILKFPIYHLSKKTYSVYNNLYPVLCISVLITIFIYWL